MRLIDADALVEKMNLAIAVLKMTMKNFDIEDDSECQMELKAYQDIRDRIKEEPTIEPERKTGTWQRKYSRLGVYADLRWHCSICGGKFSDTYANMWKYCPDCGAKMEGEQ